MENYIERYKTYARECIDRVLRGIKSEVYESETVLVACLTINVSYKKGRDTISLSHHTKKDRNVFAATLVDGLVESMTENLVDSINEYDRQGIGVDIFLN